MATKETALALMNDPIAQELLCSTNMAKLAYTLSDGSPRVVPVWFHWTGKEIVMAGPVKAPKMQAIHDNSPVAITIDRNEWPYHTLMVRGTAHVSTVDGVVPEYRAAAQRYLGPEQGAGWCDNIAKMFPNMVRIAVTPETVHILDFDKRFPKAIADAMAGK